MHRHPNRLFRDYELSKILERQNQAIISRIQSEKDEYLSQINQEEYLDYIQSEFEISYPILFEDQKECQLIQRKIRRYDQFINREFEIDGVELTVSIPFEGDKTLFLAQANTYSSCAPEGTVTENKIIITYQMSIAESENFDLEKSLTPKLNDIKRNLGFTENDLKSFNENIKRIAQNEINTKLSNYSKFNNLIKNIPYPIKRETHVPSTFEIPKVVRKPKIERPVQKDNAISEPTLSNAEYDHILKICSDMSLVMERSPKVFVDIDEETLRTHFLFQLNGHYQGQATGETFNSIGKTDILIRNENQNVFIAECKFWKGEQVYKDTIDQLLGYVTYRDTKTAVLVFVRNKDFTNVLDKIQEITPMHGNFIRKETTYKAPIDSAYRYVFKNKNDENKEFLLTVIAFHIPDAAK